MGDLIIEQNITLDGVIEAVDGWFEPQSDDEDTSDLMEVVRQQMSEEGAFVLGRSTFEDMRGFWPTQTDDTTGITAHLNQVDKYVFSSTLSDPAWENTTVLDGELTEEIARVKAATHGDIGVTGSISLCHQLIAAGLVDLYRLYLFPHVIGRGRTLFPAGTDISLALESSRTFRSGITLVTYRPL